MKQPRSDAQIEASRANGAKSNGPVTPEGKAVSKFNALRHGIFSPALLLPGESEDELIELLESYSREFHPRFPSEYALVDEMVAARWRILRLLRFEQQHPPASLADMERSARLHARLQRQHDSAVKLILLVQQNEPKDPPKSNKALTPHYEPPRPISHRDFLTAEEKRKLGYHDAAAAPPLLAWSR